MENSELPQYHTGKTVEQQIAERPYGLENGRCAIATVAKLDVYEDCCATHGVTPHFARTGHACVACATERGLSRAQQMSLRRIGLLPKPVRVRSARAIARTEGHALYLGVCPTHGETAHSVLRGTCMTCRTTDGVMRAPTGQTAPNPRAEARRAGLPTYSALCDDHGVTPHSVTHGRCLTCYTTGGVLRTMMRIR